MRPYTFCCLTCSKNKRISSQRTYQKKVDHLQLDMVNSKELIKTNKQGVIR